MWQQHYILETCLWKLKSLSKTTPKLRTLSYGHNIISLSSNFTRDLIEQLRKCRRINDPIMNLFEDGRFFIRGQS